MWNRLTHTIPSIDWHHIQTEPPICCNIMIPNLYTKVCQGTSNGKMLEWHAWKFKHIVFLQVIMHFHYPDVWWHWSRRNYLQLRRRSEEIHGKKIIFLALTHKISPSSSMNIWKWVSYCAKNWYCPTKKNRKLVSRNWTQAVSRSRHVFNFSLLICQVI